MSGSPILQNAVPYRKIIIVALITIPLFGLSGATPMPMLLLGNFTFKEVRFGFFAVMLTVFSFWLINILLLYFFSKYINKRYYWIRYMVSILLCALSALAIMSAIRGSNSQPFQGFKQPPHVRFRIRGGREIFVTQKQRPFFFNFFHILPGQSNNIIILVLLEVILLRNRKSLIEKEYDLLRLANLETKHNLLKQQLQPHFLFNSLTVVKALIKKDAHKANNYVDMLSRLLRYSIYSNNNYTVTIKEELEYVKTYLDMQKIRFGNTLTFSIDIPTELLSGTVPIHSIQLLVENAQKHNVFSESRPLFIRIKGDEVSGTITVKNNLQVNTKIESQEGLGLKNLSERYKLLGGEALHITKTASEFAVKLKRLDDEDSYNRR